MQFYQEALGLREVQRKTPEDGRFIIVFLGDGKTDFRLELTWLRDHPQKYDLGECEFHLALRAEDYEAAHAKHAAMGCICFENPATKTRRWESISFPIQTGIGLKSSQPGRAEEHQLSQDALQKGVAHRAAIW